MKIIVNKNYVLFDVNTKVNKREFKATPLEFSFSEEYEGLTCKCVFSKIPATQDEEVTFYQQPIIDDKCYIPYEVMDAEGILIGVYGYSVDGDKLLLRYSPKPKNLWFLEGSYYEGAETPEEILPSQFEQYTAYLNSQIERLNRINIETEELPDGVKISVTNANGVTTETEVYNGEKGEPGERGEPGEPGTTDYEDLINKPSINGTTLEGDVSLEDIGIDNVFTIKGSVSTPEDLPMTGNSIGDVYYVESVMAGYVWIEVSGTERWEELGEPIDLSDYYTKTETDSLLDDKQDTLTAGTGIDITNNVISASGGSGIEGDLSIYTWDGEVVSSSDTEKIAMFQSFVDEVIAGKKPILLISKYASIGNSGEIHFPIINYRWISNLHRINISGFYTNSVSQSKNNVINSYTFLTYINCNNNNQVTSVSSIDSYGNYGHLFPSSWCDYSNSGNNYNNASNYYLSPNNFRQYNVTTDWQPAHKKYVDDKPTTYAG